MGAEVSKDERTRELPLRSVAVDGDRKKKKPLAHGEFSRDAAVSDVSSPTIDIGRLWCCCR